ncbi:hypothetical protein EBZ37_10960, partial [bacterium]|nr:hypothetical protein [bacterium]
NVSSTAINPSTNDLLKRAEEEGNVEEMLGYWCYRTDTDYTFSLDTKLRVFFDASPGQTAQHIVAFLKSQIELHGNGAIRTPLAPGKGVDSLPTGASLITNDSVAAILRAIQRLTLGGGGSNALDDSSAQFFSKLSEEHRSKQQANPNAFAFSPNEKAHSLTQALLRGELSVSTLAEKLQKFRAAEPEECPDRQVLSNLVRNVLDDIKYVHKYPDADLKVTAALLGTMIRSKDLMASKMQGMALRYILEALKKNPEAGGGHEKVFRFGQIATQNLLQRIADFPQFCALIKDLPHIEKQSNDIYREAVRHASITPSASSTLDQDQTSSLENRESTGLEDLASDLSLGAGSSSATSAPAGGIIERMVSNNVDVEVVETPSAALSDQVLFHVNNIAKSNVEQKVGELRKLLKPEYYGWFASFLVMKRISTQPNYHALYMNVLELLDSPQLTKQVLHSTFFHITQLLQSPTIYTTSSSERSLLRNLGIWLGQMTLAKNRPILQRRLDLKELVFWAYETGKLIAICSFVVKIVEGCKESVVFRPP